MQTLPTIFSTDSAKAAKATGYGYLNGIHYMAPASTGGHGNLCSHASAHCMALCLGEYSGQAAMVRDLEHGTNSVRESRKSKARLFMTERATYLNHMARSTQALIRKAKREGLAPCVRLNGSTDIAFERISFVVDERTAKRLSNAALAGRVMTLLQLFPQTQFVDYTKNPNRLGKAPANLHLTLSFSGDNWHACQQALTDGHNVAIVFRDGLPETYQGWQVINGDLHDLRQLDPQGATGVIVGLSPKGLKAKRTQTPFIIERAQWEPQAIAA